MNYSQFKDKLKYDKEKIYETGICAFNGWTSMQHYKAFGYFWDLIEKQKPARVIEIGTAAGGFTRFLKYTVQELNLNTKIISYDTTINTFNKPLLDDTLIDLRIKDCFEGDRNNFNELSNDIAAEGLSIVLCDGGWKYKEFNMLSPFLKSGDIIMTHDYCHDRDTFLKNIYGKVWNWHECEFSHISKAVTDNNLQPFMQELFQEAVWGSFRKS